MTSYVYNSGFVFARQWQKTLREIHCSKEIHIRLKFNHGICLPFKFSETHNARIVHQIAKL